MSPERLLGPDVVEKVGRQRVLGCWSSFLGSAVHAGIGLSLGGGGVFIGTVLLRRVSCGSFAFVCLLLEQPLSLLLSFTQLFLGGRHRKA